MTTREEEYNKFDANARRSKTLLGEKDKIDFTYQAVVDQGNGEETEEEIYEGDM